jgi:hypothetical protein
MSVFIEILVSYALIAHLGQRSLPMSFHEQWDLFQGIRK